MQSAVSHKIHKFVHTIAQIELYAYQDAACIAIQGHCLDMQLHRVIMIFDSPRAHLTSKAQRTAGNLHKLQEAYKSDQGFAPLP